MILRHVREASTCRVIKSPLPYRDVSELENLPLSNFHKVQGNMRGLHDELASAVLLRTSTSAEDVRVLSVGAEVCKVMFVDGARETCQWLERLEEEQE
jgi:hypothetical protein